MAKADMIFANAKAFTLEPTKPCAEAVASRGADLLVCPSNHRMRFETAESNHSRIKPKKKPWLAFAFSGQSRGRMACGPTAVINPDGQVFNQCYEKAFSFRLWFKLLVT